jgi:hypothetical protein
MYRSLVVEVSVSDTHPRFRTTSHQKYCRQFVCPVVDDNKLSVLVVTYISVLNTDYRETRKSVKRDTHNRI